MIGFGLDLAGFSNERGTILACIIPDGRTAEVLLLDDSPFSQKLGNDEFPARLASETKALSRLLKIGCVAVDVPIDLQDLQDLRRGAGANASWQLTKRHVDNELDGLAPLASWLGACVARFQAILSPELWSELGHKLFETYPKASLEGLFENDPVVSRYKLANKEKSEEAKSARSELTTKLKIEFKNGYLSHDELDAIVCAVTAVAQGDDLRVEQLVNGSLPRGYRLLERNPFRRVRVARMQYADWMRERAA